jgi:hypothetical protein
VAGGWWLVAGGWWLVARPAVVTVGFQGKVTVVKLAPGPTRRPLFLLELNR